MKTAISIPDDLFEAADRVARRLGLSRSELYQRAIARYIEGQSDQAITDQLDSLYASEGDSRVDPVLEVMQGTGLVREDW